MKPLMLGCCAIILVFSTLVSAVTHTDNHYAANKSNGYVAYMSEPETLVIELGTSTPKREVHLPRVQQASEFSWSNDNRYLTFTTHNQHLWLYDTQLATLRLIESMPSTAPESKYSPQWSNAGNWLLFISHNQTEARPRVYSPLRKHSYALPMSADDFSHIAWANHKNEITLLDFVGKRERLASFKLFGITLTATDARSLMALKN
ncbi:hypothetical protein Q4524_02600 [Alteromonas stellipolaris]|uniref:hypothetical protein n=1 Tax=Alteromonas stellipolaris TaxID=233316 RepID=UPI0026E46969|nr:hypothetical protein [Alteromonas stellipolaris]MDO6537462.1 hypothetical protein [Alteromonas stellipolaris]